MDKQAELNLSKAELLDNNHFKIQVGGNEYIYQVPETKEAELVVEKNKQLGKQRSRPMGRSV